MWPSLAKPGIGAIESSGVSGGAKLGHWGDEIFGYGRWPGWPQSISPASTAGFTNPPGQCCGSSELPVSFWRRESPAPARRFSGQPEPIFGLARHDSSQGLIGRKTLDRQLLGAEQPYLREATDYRS